MWRESEFFETSLDQMFDRLRAAFSAARDPLVEQLRPGRPEGQVLEVLSGVTVDPHPDLVAWFANFDGVSSQEFAFGLGVGGGRILSLSEVSEHWLDSKESFEGDYETYSSDFVPFGHWLYVDCSSGAKRGTVVSQSGGGEQFYEIPSLRHLLWWWIALREERVFSAQGLPIEWCCDQDELESFRNEFVLVRFREDPDRGPFPMAGF